jgi:hypothetical protein
MYSRVHKRPPLVCILNQINLVHTDIFYIFQIRFNITLPCFQKKKSDNSRYYVGSRSIYFVSYYSRIHTEKPTDSNEDDWVLAFDP